MKRLDRVVLAVAALVCSCAEQKGRQAETGPWLSSVDTANCLVLDKPAAVLLLTRFEDNAESMSEEDAATVADDIAYYHYEAGEYFKKVGVPVISTFDSSLVFRRGDGRWYRLERDSIQPDLVVWNGRDLPLVTGSAGFHDTLHAYMPELPRE